MSGTIIQGEVLAYWNGALSPLIALGDASNAAFRDVRDRYDEPHRRYHNLDHIRQVLVCLDMYFEPNVFEAPALYLAAILHDAIYDPRAKDNEERSADYAHELLASMGVDRGLREEVARLILLTRTHEAEESDRDGQALLDADLSVLGATPTAYDAYAAAIRREYDWVSDEAYRSGRRAVLERFLTRPHLYCTPTMQERCEETARANLAREIASLK